MVASNADSSATASCRRPGFPAHHWQCTDSVKQRPKPTASVLTTPQSCDPCRLRCRCAARTATLTTYPPGHPSVWPRIPAFSWHIDGWTILVMRGSPSPRSPPYLKCFHTDQSCCLAATPHGLAWSHSCCGRLDHSSGLLVRSEALDCNRRCWTTSWSR